MTRPLPCGIGLRAPHIGEIEAARPPVGFLEVHTENYFGGGARLKTLERLRAIYPLSFHGVGMSLGRADGLDRDHLAQVAELVARYRPMHVSEHLSWSAYGHVAVPDLLPLPFTHEALDIMCRHVDQFQEAVGQQVLIENPSNYLAFDGLDFSEPDFLNRLARRTGCAILLDINNIYVSARNLGRDASAYLDALDPDVVAQYHLAGHDAGPGALLIDTHGQPVCDAVWALYDDARRRFGDHPALVEWDSAIPPLEVLLGEAFKADQRRGLTRQVTHAH